MKPMVAKIQEPKNQLVITLVTLTILLLVWGPVRPTEALDNHIKSSGNWTLPCDDPKGLACMLEGREGAATTQIYNVIVVTHGFRAFPLQPSNCPTWSSPNDTGCDSKDTRIYDIDKNMWLDPTPTGPTGVPVPRSELAGATDGHLHYAVGGRSGGENGTVVGNLEAYDPVANTWTDLTTSPTNMTPRAGLAAVIVGGKLYAIGGRNATVDIHGTVIDPGSEPGHGTALKCIEAYDIAAGTWTSSSNPGGSTDCATIGGELASMPQPAMDVAAIAHGGKIYVIGGACGPDDGKFCTPPSPGTPNSILLNTVQIYDVATNTWSPTGGATMPTPRANLALATCGDVILAVGGRTVAAGRDGVVSPIVEAYEIPTNTWSMLPLNPMKTSKSEHGAVSHGGKVYVAGSGMFGDAGSDPKVFPNTHSLEALTCSSLFSNKK